MGANAHGTARRGGRDILRADAAVPVADPTKSGGCGPGPPPSPTGSQMHFTVTRVVADVLPEFITQ